MHVLRCFPCPFDRRPAFFLLVAVLVCGCGDDSGVGQTFPVRGRITVGSEPLTASTTVVLFKPDAAKGNTSPFEPTGTVDAEGNYTLHTNGKKGAPAGWYKVVVTAAEAPSFRGKGPRTQMPGAKSLVAAKYGQAKTTDLAVEVIENPAPGAYDLKLTR
jgi:hypothetical protein